MINRHKSSISLHLIEVSIYLNRYYTKHPFSCHFSFEITQNTYHYNTRPLSFLLIYFTKLMISRGQSIVTSVLFAATLAMLWGEIRGNFRIVYIFPTQAWRETTPVNVMLEWSGSLEAHLLLNIARQRPGKSSWMEKFACAYCPTFWLPNTLDTYR